MVSGRLFLWFGTPQFASRYGLDSEETDLCIQQCVVWSLRTLQGHVMSVTSHVMSLQCSSMFVSWKLLFGLNIYAAFYAFFKHVKAWNYRRFQGSKFWNNPSFEGRFSQAMTLPVPTWAKSWLCIVADVPRHQIFKYLHQIRPLLKTGICKNGQDFQRTKLWRKSSRDNLNRHDFVEFSKRVLHRQEPWECPPRTMTPATLVSNLWLLPTELTDQPLVWMYCHVLLNAKRCTLCLLCLFACVWFSCITTQFSYETTEDSFNHSDGHCHIIELRSEFEAIEWQISPEIGVPPVIIHFHWIFHDFPL